MKSVASTCPTATAEETAFNSLDAARRGCGDLPLLKVARVGISAYTSLSLSLQKLHSEEFRPAYIV